MTDGRGIDAIVGRVHRPCDTRYDEACVIYNRLYRARPALVIRPVDGHDVAGHWPTHTARGTRWLWGVADTAWRGSARRSVGS